MFEKSTDTKNARDKGTNLSLSVKNEEKVTLSVLEAEKCILTDNIKERKMSLSRDRDKVSKEILLVKSEEKVTLSVLEAEKYRQNTRDTNVPMSLAKRERAIIFPERHLLEHTNLIFPREGLVIESKHPYRISYYTPKEYLDYFNKHNGKRNIFCSVYSFQKWKANLEQRRYEPDIESVILDKIYIDLDFSAEKQQTLETAYKDMTSLIKALNGITDLFPRVYFSGNKGFAIYFDFKPIRLTQPKESIISIVKAFEEKLELQTIDWGIVGDLRRVSRAPYSKHLKSGLYCTPIPLEEILQGITLEEILSRAAKQYFVSMEIKESAKFADLLTKKDSENGIQKEHNQTVKNWYKLKSKTKKVAGLRPIITRAIDNLSQLHSFPGAHLCRLAIACELIASGYSDDYIVNLFLFHDTNAREDKTRYQVEQIRKGTYKPFTKEKLREIGLFDFIKKTIGVDKEK